jgi:tRNA nucleotidyltransferase/poly(A) polymerase
MLVRPSMESLAPHLRAATVAIARRLRSSGRQAWLVGGAVRDMALGKAPKDLDLATDALPDEVESLFERTAAVGKAFGTIVVVFEGVETQVTTFRSELGHHDGRRPSQVSFSADLREDAARRDFTCNALYLDPLDDALDDPFGGLDDLRAGRLRTVGDARQRFAEDGLRLVRMARLAAANELEIDPPTFEAARASLSALRGVSPERRLGELLLIFERHASARALRLLERAGVLEVLCPGHAELAASDVGPKALDLRWRALEALGERPGAERGFAVLFDPTWGQRSADAAALARAHALVAALRPSRALLDGLAATWRLEQRFHALDGPAAAPRAARVKLVRDPQWPAALACLRAWRAADGAPAAELEQVQTWAASLAPEDLRPAPLLTSDDLAHTSIPRGPHWKRVLELAEERQLEGELDSRARALEWLAREARAISGAGGG